MLIISGTEQYRIFLRAVWLKAAKSPVALSIKVDDRHHMRNALYKERAEMEDDFSNYHIVFPKQDNELWIVRRYDQPKRRAFKKGNFELVPKRR